MFYRADRAGLTLQIRTQKNGGHPAGQVPQFSIERLEQRSVLSGDPLTVVGFSTTGGDAGIETIESAIMPLGQSPILDVATQSFFVGTPGDSSQGGH